MGSRPGIVAARLMPGRWRGTRRSLPAPVQAPQAQGLSHVRDPDLLDRREVGDAPRELEAAMTRTRREPELRRCLREQALCRGLRRTVAAHLAWAEARVQASGALELT